MKNFLKILVLIFIFAALYQYREPIKRELSPYLANLKYNFKHFVLRQKPCEEPIPYKLGTFDTKFGISKEYFLSALADAESIWEKSARIDLFNYAPSDTDADVLKVNLVYDYRQEATSKLASLGIVVQNNKASYESLKAKFETLKAEYERDKKIFNARVNAFNNQKVRTESEAKELQRMQEDLNKKVDEINALVVAINRLISSLNLSVDKYNTTNVSRGESFEEGVYSSDGLQSEIDIYEFSSRSKLVRVLAHELGHALGIEHVADSKAIMYELNQSNSLALTSADFAALKAQCEGN